MLIVAPDRWGAMRVAKHHYACALAAVGCDVVYLERPGPDSAHYQWRTVTDDAVSLRIARYRPLLPTATRFHARRLHEAGIRWRVRGLLRRMGFRPDVLLSFDSTLIHSDLKAFGAAHRVFMPMDAVSDRRLARVAAQSHAVITVSEVIAEPFRAAGAPTFVIDHGLAPPFERAAVARRLGPPHASQGHGAQPVRVGYSGNLGMGPVLDRDIIIRIINANPAMEFHFFGAESASNVGDAGSGEAPVFVEFLRSRSNVHLHGALPQSELALRLAEMNLLLLAYDVRHDPNRCSNSHKIIEYLSTGRPIVSTRITAYDGRPDLLEMLPTFDNSGLPALLAKTALRLDELSTSERAERRVTFALDRTYQHHLSTIEQILRHHGS